MKKIPPGAEASNVLVGEVDFLEKPIIAFVRLSPAVLITGLTEVPVPTRYDNDIEKENDGCETVRYEKHVNTKTEYKVKQVCHWG